MFLLSKLSSGSFEAWYLFALGLFLRKTSTAPFIVSSGAFFRLKTLCREDCCQRSHEYDVFKSTVCTEFTFSVLEDAL